jgi:ferredoxin
MAFGARGRQIANMAIGLNDVFVLQSASSNLVRCRDRILKAMNYAGPALISVFSGTSGQAGELPPYLTAAAAMESRAFPAFSYDPSAGRDWASRFALDDNPQPERDWPIHQLAYEDAEHQRVTEEVAFTLIDFVACDRRYAGHFAPIAPANGNAALAAVASCLDREARSLPGQFPSLLMVDRDNTLRRVIVDESLIREARRCREAWRSLQQLGRIGEASATAADTRAPQETAQALPPAVAPATASVTLPSAAPEKERASGEPYIETVRCSSCNECIQLNSKMFAYDANQQAYIVDPDAGTYRQLVEAAESCQVAVIHPGKPRNPAESDLEELLKRAERFL